MDIPTTAAHHHTQRPVLPLSPSNPRLHCRPRIRPAETSHLPTCLQWSAHRRECARFASLAVNLRTVDFSSTYGNSYRLNRMISRSLRLMVPSVKSARCTSVLKDNQTISDFGFDCSTQEWHNRYPPSAETRQVGHIGSRRRVPFVVASGSIRFPASKRSP